MNEPYCNNHGEEMSEHKNHLDEIARLKAINAELLEACKYLMECVYAGTTQIIEQDPEYGQSPTTSSEMIEAAIANAQPNQGGKAELTDERFDI